MLVVTKSFPFFQIIRKKDQFEYFFNEFSDEEKKLIKLTAPELAKEYDIAKNKKDNGRCLLIEHYLSLRLFKLQSRSTLTAAIIASISAIAGGLLTYLIGAFCQR
jgi:hypothetical protein